MNKRNHKRRAKKVNAPSQPYTSEQLSDRHKMFGNACAYCDRPASSTDHLIALNKGGADALHNLVPACKPCNSSKKNQDVATWFQKQPFYTLEKWQRILRIINT